MAKPTPWDANIRSGRTAMQSGDYEQADRLLKTALDDTRKFKDNDPRMGVTLHSMAELYLRQGNYSLAKEYYERALPYDQKIQGPEGLDVADDLYGLSLCNQQMGDYLAFEVFLKRVDEIWRKKLGPKSPRLLSILPAEAAYAAMKNDLPRAEACYRQTLDILDSESDKAKKGLYLNLLAATLGNEGKLSEARQTAEQALALLKNSNEPSIVKDSAEENLAFIETKVEAHIVDKDKVDRDKVDGDKKDSSKKEQALNPEKEKPALPASAQDDGKPPLVAKSDVNTAETQGTQNGSPRPWETERVIKKNDPNNESNSGKVRYLTGGRLVSPEEYKAMLLANQAYEMMRQEKYRMAVDLLHKALDEYPNLASAHTNIGLALARMGQFDEAIEHLKTSIALKPGRSAAWLNLASSFQNSGRLDDAVATYNEYLSRFPSDTLAIKTRTVSGQLQKEIDEQAKVASGKNNSDYFPYTTRSITTRWSESKMPIKVYIAKNSSIPGFKEEYSGLLADAFKQWSLASSGAVKFEFMSGPEKADIACAWTDNPAQVSTSSEGGEAKLSWGTEGIKHANITILTVDPTPDSPLSQNQLKAVCLHEVGHSLGLVGHSPHPADVMYCTMPSAESKSGISRRDIGTLQHLYAPNTVIGVKGCGLHSMLAAYK